MSYVCIAELFAKSEEYFSHDRDHTQAKLYTTLSFFLGALFVWLSAPLINLLAPDAQLLGHDHGDGQGWHMDNVMIPGAGSKLETVATNNSECKRLSEVLRAQLVKDLYSTPAPQPSVVVAADTSELDDASEDKDSASCVSSSIASNEDERQKLSDSIRSRLMNDLYSSSIPAPSTGAAVGLIEPADDERSQLFSGKDGEIGLQPISTPRQDSSQPVSISSSLYTMGLRTVFAVALHNFPEGFAAFCTTLANGRSGMGIAFGIILHNIPEGLCVAAPIYAATGSKSQAICFAAIAAAAELAGGCTAQIMISGSGGDLSNGAYGLLYGVVCGIVVVIAILEFLSHAFEVDKTPTKRWVTGPFILGMAFIALTLVTEDL